MRLLAVALWLMVRVVHGPARWFARRLTTAGAMVVAGLLVSGGVAHPTQTLGLPAFLVLAALLASAVAWAPFFRSRLSVRRDLPRLAACGEPVRYPVTVTNRTRRWQRGLVIGEEIPKPPPALGEIRRWLRRGGLAFPSCPPVVVPPIPPGGSVTVTLTITARRRGLLQVPRMLVSRADPLGLFRGFQTLRAPGEILVLPPRHSLPPFDLPGIGRHQPGGTAHAAGVGAAEEFAALRDYRRGDPMRHIHWRSSARTGELVVQERHDEELVRHALVLDPGVTDDLDRFEDAVAVAASFACTIPDQEVLLDLLFVGDQALVLTSGRGVGHAGSMLEALAGIAPRPEAWPALAALVRAHQPRLSGCLLVLLDLDGPRRALVADLRRRGVTVVVLLVGDDPGDLPPEERPDRLVLLTPGRIATGLATLGTRS